MNADHRFAQRAQGFEAGVAKIEAELIFALCMEGTATFTTGGVRRALALLPDVNFWMDFERIHILPPAKTRTRYARL